MNRNILQIEESLINLQDRRRHLDQKITSKFQSLAKFDNIRTNSNARIHNAIIEQNERASIRNKELLVKISQINATGDHHTNIKKSNCLQNLNEARLEYCTKMEAILPFHYRQNSIQLEEKIKLLKMEKMQSSRRRERLRVEMENEDRAKFELEQQRRELVVLRALEQQDVFRSEASYAILREEGRVVDESIAQQSGQSTRYLNRLVAESKMSIDAIVNKQHQLSDYSSLLSPSAVPPKYQQHEQFHPPTEQNSSEVHQINNIKPENYDRHFTPTLSSVSEASPASSPPSVAPSPHLHQQSGGEKASRQIHFAQVPDVTTNISHHRYINTTPDRSPTRFEVADRWSFEPNSPVTELHDRHAAATEETENNRGHGARSHLLEEKETQVVDASNPDASVLVDELPVTPSSTSYSPLLLRADPKHTSPSKYPVVSPQTEKIRSQEKSEDESADRNRRPVVAVTESTTADDLRLLLADTKQCIVCVRQLFAAIEHRLMFSAHISSIYTYTSLSSSGSARLSEIAQYVSLLAGGSEGALRGERDRQQLEDLSANEELLGDTVLAIVQTQCSLLAPKDAFSGVVTLDKLKKEHKKGRSPAAAVELWEGLAAHLQKVVEINSAYKADLTSCFVGALVSQVSDDDLDRFTRKVSTLIALVFDSTSSSGVSTPPPPSHFTTQPSRSTFANSAVSKPTRFISYDSMQLPSARASEFEDEELLDDEVVERPPALRDIDHRAQRPDDEFDF